MKPKMPRILFFDIETSPNLAYVWGKWEQDVISFKKEWELISFAYKWQGDSEVKCYTRADMPGNSEKKLVEKLWKLLNEADVVIAHNGDEFDNKKARAKFVQFGLKPPKPYKTIDTKKMAKSNFMFNSNSLNDLGETLKLGKKKDTGGFDLWLGCMAGNQDSWDKMASYNKQDVRLLEKVYDKLKIWDEKHIDLAQAAGFKDRCPICASMHIIGRGWAYARASKRARLCCKDCGHWFRGPVRLLK